MKPSDKPETVKKPERKSTNSNLQEALIASEIRYRRLFESAKDGILILDAETGKIIDVNPFLIALLNYPKENFIDKELWEIGFFKDIAANKEKFIELQQQEYVRYDNLPLETADGRKINVEFVSNVYVANKKKVIQCNIRDITERKRSENALTTSETRLRTLVQTIPDLIWLKDVDGVYLSCNPMFERFFGAMEADIAGKTDYDFVERELAGSFRENDRKAILAGKPTSNEEWITFADDGHRAYLETIKAPMYDAQKNLIGILGIGRDISKRRQTLELLGDSELNYRTLANSGQALIWTAGTDKLCNYFNTVWLEFTGRTLDEEMGNGWADGVHPDDLDRCLDIYVSAFDQHEKFSMEYRLRRHDGEYRWLLDEGCPRYNSKEEFIGYIGHCLDITESKNAKEALVISELRFRTLYENAKIGLYRTTPDGTILLANKALVKMLGYASFEQLVNRNLENDGYEQTYQRKEFLEKIEKDGEVNDFESAWIRQDGSKFFVRESALAIRDSNNVTQHYDGVVEDITERKLAEEEIAMLSQSLKSVNECVSITDVENKILFVNQSFLNTYGYDSDELVGQNISKVALKSNEQLQVNEILPATIRGAWQGELLNRKKNGSVFPIHLSTNIIRDRKSKVLGLIGIATDITERKHVEKELVKAKEKAEESDRLKSAFLANMSHEIRTPMNGILGFTELLKEPYLTGAEQTKYISIIEKSGARMLNIINDIISISKVESGQVDVYLSTINLNEQMVDLFNFFKEETDQKKLLLSCHNGLSSKESVIKTDIEKVVAVLTNLVKNAIKFTKAGSIEFGYEKKGDFLEFFVKDTGAGVPIEQRELIFERFRQGSELLTRNYEGAGLGLAISKAYVKMLGGNIWITNNPGKFMSEGLYEKNGSIFYFTIPYCHAAEVKSADIIEISDSHEEDQSSFDASGLKILVAEDEEISASLISLILKKTAKEVIKVRTGAEAVEACQNNQDIDVVLMDVKMPVMNGYEATRRIREFNTKLPIIAQTAYGLKGDMEKAIEAGCNDYISKPIISALLIQKIKSVLEK